VLFWGPTDKKKNRMQPLDLSMHPSIRDSSGTGRQEAFSAFRTRHKNSGCEESREVRAVVDVSSRSFGGHLLWRGEGQRVHA
jgi:hypothetical protein